MDERFPEVSFDCAQSFVLYLGSIANKSVNTYFLTNTTINTLSFSQKEIQKFGFSPHLEAC